MPTSIEWVQNPDGTKGESWNPITGCSHAGSPGCDHCYAKRMAQRLKGRYGYPKDNPFKVTFHPDRLDQPLRWKKPRRIFVVSMGDLFHENVKREWIDRIFHVMACASQHTYLLLTKRPERMKNYWMGEIPIRGGAPGYTVKKAGEPHSKVIDHIWLGVTAENQEQADKRIPILLQIPAAVKFVSIEPMLGPIDIVPYIGHLTHECECGFHRDEMHIFPMGSNWLCPECGKMTINREAISWVIVGGESGPGARPMHPDWARSIRDQCQSAGVPFFFKQWGEWVPITQSAKGILCRKMISMFPDGEINGEMRPLYKDCPKGEGLHVGGEFHLLVGKKKAGRILDGRTWDEYPK